MNRLSAGIWWLRNPPTRGYTHRILRGLGAEVGNRVVIKRSLFIDNAIEDENSTGDLSHLRIGDRVYMGDGVYLDLANEVRIADDALIGAHSRFVTHFDWRGRMPRICAPVTVEHGALVGVGAILLAGSTVAVGSMLAAGAMLGQGVSTEPGTIWGGVPAKRIGVLPSEDHQARPDGKVLSRRVRDDLDAG